MSRIAYSLLFYLLTPLILVRLLLRSRQAPAYRNRWSERFGRFRVPADWQSSPGAIWVHAVSVGETMAAAPLIRLLLGRYPDRRLVVTTMTPTGSERVRALFGDSVFHVYLPYDLPGAMARLLGKLNPALLIIMETELWPNLLHQCRRAGCRTMVVNARLSGKSARGYRRLGPLTRGMLGEIDLIAAQAAPDRERFMALGAAPDRVEVVGSLKFDIMPPPAADLPPFFAALVLLQRPILVAGSTREGEEEKVLLAFRQCLAALPQLLLVLVPRHPERFDSVARLCKEQGFNLVRRSRDESCDETTQVLLGDSMGEMWNYYAVGDLAFVGGSLVDTGCHNVLEPAALGIPVLIGPSRFNFETISRQLQESGALVIVADADELARQVLQLLDEPLRRQEMGTAGRRLVESNRGCLQRLAERIDAQLTAS
ncbi:MAG: lipid IV(A) 3-deoxy-D-manno-octulosonic acid transferase [Gammaproteobacteria bacterium]|nr:lipid IV(A) 3-deoxy-D-manno-octulosonic acid transferase [Pseudomonadales bacterium]MCP5347576.1 lipid IV(A) 3-deoxy-D-manno-octulosonic acid transferase [Pseudomonadales bacterium]